jgi:sulfite reductase beta subunit-like hemoprotein/ferredoxin-NADP reductase/nitrite reductase/ring-hydroxylating ferredoxin subunit
LQVQGLGIEHLPEVTRRLERVGLSAQQTGHDNIRNVFAHPYSGLLPDELVDTRQLCHAITALFLDSREYADLPRKMNICLNGTAQHSAHFWTQDISFLATTDEDGEVLFQVLIAGTQGQNPHLAWHLPVLGEPGQVVDVTRAILDLFRAQGSREKRGAARLRYLVEKIGVAGFLDWLEEKLPYRLRPGVSEPIPASSHDELIGWFRQRDPKLWTMGLSVPLGRLTWQQLEGLAILSKRWGDGQLRTTHEQGIAVINIPRGFKDAAATAAAAHDLSIHADPLELNTIACTGSQFCNIAVTETKGHMFQLIERLRKKSLKLHGIRIHMSGCPSSCAQHFTADIGLKGVRVRRLLGTREGFDVFLGGGIAGQVHMALPYKLGVDVDQLPTLVETVVDEYYRLHKPGQTFSAYWREQLQAKQADKAADNDYQTPTWLCENCDYQHRAEDPPVFCPSCAGLRRYFARLDGDSMPETAADSLAIVAAPAARSDGFLFAAENASLTEAAGLTVEVAGQELALFRVNGKVQAIDSACPHEGAPLAQGEIKDGVVTCPWHAWRFNACTGCSIEPAGNDVKRYEALVEDGKIFVRLEAAKEVAASDPKAAAPHSIAAKIAAMKAGTTKPTAAAASTLAKTKLARPVELTLPVLDVIEESSDVRTFRLDNSAGKFPLDLAGRFLKVCVPIAGEEVWRSFTICSAPTTLAHVDLTIKLNPTGVVSSYLFAQIKPGSLLKVKGPQGGFCFDPAKHAEPLVLVSAGSGITPMMSIARQLQATGSQLPCTFLFGGRTPADILFHDECRQLASTLPAFRYFVTLSRPSDDWTGNCGRLDAELLRQQVAEPAAHRWFLCGPNDFMESLRAALESWQVPTAQIHTEQFHALPLVAS